MGLIGAHIPGSGLLGIFFLGVLAAPYYFCLARESNGKAPVAPGLSLRWLAPLNERGAMQGFFLRDCPQAQCRGSGLDYAVYSGGCVLIGVLTFVLLCMAVMLRKAMGGKNERPGLSPDFHRWSDLIEDDGVWGDIVPGPDAE